MGNKNKNKPDGKKYVYLVEQWDTDGDYCLDVYGFYTKSEAKKFAEFVYPKYWDNRTIRTIDVKGYTEGSAIESVVVTYYSHWPLYPLFEAFAYATMPEKIDRDVMYLPTVKLQTAEDAIEAFVQKREAMLESLNLKDKRAWFQKVRDYVWVKWYFMMRRIKVEIEWLTRNRT